jgi:glycerophosphoryl diester phosphodiesterase
VWTVNAEEDLRRCRDIGVDVVISDRPDLALRVLAEPSEEVGRRT